jgi:hypothetical protein
VHELAEAVAMQCVRALELQWVEVRLGTDGGARLYGDARKKMGRGRERNGEE